MRGKKQKIEVQPEDALEKLKERQEDWEMEQSLEEFLTFVRREETPDSLKELILKERT